MYGIRVCARWEREYFDNARSDFVYLQHGQIAGLVAG